MECAHCHRDKPGKEYSFYYGVENELSHEFHSWGAQGVPGSGYSSKTVYKHVVQGQDQRFICNVCIFKYYDWRVPFFRILRLLAVIIVGVAAMVPLGKYEEWFFIPFLLVFGLLVLFGLCTVPLWLSLRERNEKDKYFSKKRSIFRRRDMLELWAADIAGYQQNLYTTFEKRAYLDKNKLSVADWLNKIWNPGIEWYLLPFLFYFGTVLYSLIIYY
jgi:hypothetical protein